MSIKAMTWVFDLELPPTPKLVLLVLADHADDKGFCFPGAATISRRASVSERTLTRVLADLEAKGYIARSRRHLSNGNRTSDGYVLTPDQATEWRLDETPNDEDKTPTVASVEEPSVEPPVTTPKRAPRQTQMPADLAWNNGHALKAHKRGVDVEVEFEKFKDYHLARASRFADWDRTFHTWLNNARPEPGRGGSPSAGPRTPPRTPTDRMESILAIQDPRENGMIV